ncbi:MAG: ice-binding family protein [Candidatus Doudnabacteria bacterium]
MLKFKKNSYGFTIIEMVVAIAIFAVLLVGVIGLVSVMTRSVRASREQTTIASLATNYLEVVRNLAYSQVGTAHGNPIGVLPDDVTPATIVIEGINYQVYYEVTFVDDPADGTVLLGTDAAPDDYKQVKLNIQNMTTGVVRSFSSNITPFGLEGTVNAGALWIKAFDATGQPIAGASVHIQNIAGTIILDRTTDSSGNWVEVGLPPGVNIYHIVVTKAGYSTDQTYPITVANPNPTKPDPTIVNSQVTLVSFSIDLFSKLTIKTLGATGSTCGAAQVNLGTAGSFAVLAGSTITNTGSSGINGDLGLSPGTSVTGFPPGTVNGAQHVADSTAAQAKTDLVAAYNNAAGQSTTSTIPTELGGTTETAGVYDSASGTFGITGTLTLNAQGDPNAVFIFKAASTLITAGASSVSLINGAQACNVFWQVGSSATFGTFSNFAGNVLALTSITVTTGVNVSGRMLARNGAVTLDTDTITLGASGPSTCSALSNVGVNLTGAKLIGLTPNVLKYNNNLTSSAGLIALNNLEWDNYTPTLLTGQNLMVVGTSPIQQISVLPAANQTFTMILGTQTANSLLVIVKDSGTGNALAGAGVHLHRGGATPQDFNGTTGGSVWVQSDWTGGPGQTDFAAATRYFADDGNIDNSSLPTGIRLKNISGNYVASGQVVSSTFDTGGASNFTTLTWNPTSQNPATSLKFQIASNSDNATWNFMGPDGTAGTYYTVSGTNIASIHNNDRYIRYKAFLATTDSLQTPVLTSVAINYVSGCATPGQTSFGGLTADNNYSLDVTLPGYQPFSVNSLNISGNQSIQVLMSP